MRSFYVFRRSGLFALRALLCALLLAAKTFAASSPSPLVAKFSEVLPQGATVTTTSREVSNYKMLVSAAEKVKRELRATDTIDLSGSQTRTLWQLPAGAELEQVFATVSAQMVGEELFVCSGRDCGRSTAWSTLVFSEALVYGQDRNQRYRVVQKSASEIAAVYVIRRGNRRVNLLLETLVLGPAAEHPVDPMASSVGVTGAEALTALTQSGFARLAVAPGERGELDPEAVEVLNQAGEALSALSTGTVYVVCHLYTGSDIAQLLVNSEVCAAEASSILQSALTQGLDSGVEFEAFAAGPLLPRELPGSSTAVGDKTQTNRIELVQPGHALRP